MNIFKDFKLKWWQAGFFKSAAIAFGVILGLLFPQILSPLLPFFWVVFIVSSGIVIYYWYKQ